MMWKKYKNVWYKKDDEGNYVTYDKKVKARTYAKLKELINEKYDELHKDSRIYFRMEDKEVCSKQMNLDYYDSFLYR